ncbi:hypothetical protein H6G89_25600 [Oscillatoria sp. FACHB-1407]|uniref:hypothetical protein n=1 Tax=Oscillatoria sp. FACHB-1407 TaxID=2692847 RepID=UPI00168565B2|nr:hypothetical protein [Oscillatoria sp. FACHB-1407]MBD2464385.1 hypothetical protein [Oscillatoria sp. FACHB-1407]
MSVSLTSASGKSPSIQQHLISLTLPDLAIAEMIPQLVQRAFEVGTSQMLRELRQQFTQ